MPEVLSRPTSIRDLIPFLSRHPRLLLLEHGRESAVEFRGTVVRRTPRCLRLRLVGEDGVPFERPACGHDRGSEVGLSLCPDGFVVEGPGVRAGSTVVYRFAYIN